MSTNRLQNHKKGTLQRRLFHKASVLIPVFSVSLLVFGLLTLPGCHPGPQTFEYQLPGLTVWVDESGAIQQITLPGKDFDRPIKASTRLAGCRPDGRVRVRQQDGTVTFSRRWISTGSGNTCIVTDRFSPGDGSLRWEIAVSGLDGPWSTPIETWLEYPDSTGAKFWTAWGDPRLGNLRQLPAERQKELGILASDVTGNWTDPLLPIPFVDDTIWYGAPDFRFDKPGIGFCPFQGNLFGIPLFTVSEEEPDAGISIIQSPSDTLLDMNLRVSSGGLFVLARKNHRIERGKTVRFHMDIVGHESGWMGGIRWMSAHNAGFFDPNLPQADDIAGTGAYSSLETPFDLDKMEKMAFGVNWKASFDFPYMGMFIPPVESDTTPWERYGGGTTTIEKMADYSTTMKSMGLHVLSYFNVTEFGARISDTIPPRSITDDDQLWRNANDFLYYRLADAILHVPAAVSGDRLSFYPRSKPDGLYYTWGDGIIMDPGEPVYREFLLEQARRHIGKIPDADGICIDRMDWLRMYNDRRNDNISWIGDQPARSMIVSWNRLLDELGPLMHEAGKAIFVNNHDKRIDVLRQTDGFFDEFTYGGSPLNLTALMGIRRPVMGWTANEQNLKPDPDAFFQRYLYLGVYPMAPFPGNDHSLQPSAWVDRQYMDYGLMFKQMKGKKWILEPHCIAVRDQAAKANLFEVKGAWIIPVVFGPRDGTVTVEVGPVSGMGRPLKAEVYYPGAEDPVNLSINPSPQGLSFTLALERGCGLVRISRAK
jgi:hypothetical protein